MKRILSAILAFTMLFCMIPSAFAASDIDNHWAKEYLSEMHRLEIIKPSSQGMFTPDKPVARWEFMRYVNRAFDFTEKAEIKFTDVPENSLYYDVIATAVHYGYINGVSDTEMDPSGTLTREQAATILGRLHKYEPTADPGKLPFTDSVDISDYSRNYVAEAVACGYIDGFNDGTFKPKESLTRGQIAKILYYYIGTSLNQENGTYTEADLNSKLKNVTISRPGTLENVKIAGNLFITEGVGNGKVDLKNVTVDGKIIISGGDVMLENVSALDLIISNPCGETLSVTTSGNSSIAETTVYSSALLYEKGLGVSAGGFSNLTVAADSVSVTLDASVWNLITKKACSIITSGGTMISNLTANGRTMITGSGTIQKATINANGCDFIMKPEQLTLASGVTALISGEMAHSSNSISISPSALTFDQSNPSTIAHYYDFIFGADKNELISIDVDGVKLERGSDFNLLTDKNGVRIYKTFLSTLAPGTYTATLTFQDNSSATFSVITSNSVQLAVSPSQYTFDRYEDSPNYANVPFLVTLPAGTQLASIKFGSTILERGSDYNYDVASGQVVVMAEALAKKNTGSYTLSFVPTKGASMSCALTIIDTRPVNKLDMDQVDFDANSNSGGHRDITVTLSTADGAKLNKIRYQNMDLNENWQYQINEDKVTINKTILTEIAKNGANYADLTFVMSTGRHPTLRVNFVTTYGITASVVDDLGLPIEGAVVTISPEDASEGTSTQTFTTSANGKITTYVKRGVYKVTAEHERFTAPVTQTVKAFSNSTTQLTGEILENVQIVVTNKYGAMLPGAVVMIGGKTVTTGADGVATFNLRRSNYTVQVSCTGYNTATKSITVTGSTRTQIQID